jgi:hypothetical protein
MNAIFQRGLKQTISNLKAFESKETFLPSDSLDCHLDPFPTNSLDPFSTNSLTKIFMHFTNVLPTVEHFNKNKQKSKDTVLILLSLLSLVIIVLLTRK